MRRRVFRVAAILLCALMLNPVPAHPQDDYLIVCWYQGTWRDAHGVAYDSWFCMDSLGREYRIAQEI